MNIMPTNTLRRGLAPYPIGANLLRAAWSRLGLHHQQVTPERWSINDLRAACERKRIRYEETSVYENLRGVVVRYGRTSIISIKESLPEPEKIVVLAHELAHVALHHTQNKPQYLLPASDDPHPFNHDPEKEQQAHVWAAHLLVQPAVFERFRREAETSCQDSERALHLAITRTAAALNIPPATVKLWTETREWTFPEDPKTWLARP